MEATLGLTTIGHFKFKGLSLLTYGEKRKRRDVSAIHAKIRSPLVLGLGTVNLRLGAFDNGNFNGVLFISIQRYFREVSAFIFENNWNLFSSQYLHRSLTWVIVSIPESVSVNFFLHRMIL